MTTVHEPAGVVVAEVDQDAARANLDLLAHRFLGLGGEEFLSRLSRGTLGATEQQPGFSRVLAVATLLDCARGHAG